MTLKNTQVWSFIEKFGSRSYDRTTMTSRNDLTTTYAIIYYYSQTCTLEKNASDTLKKAIKIIQAKPTRNDLMKWQKE